MKCLITGRPGVEIDELDSLVYYQTMTWQLQEAKNKLSEVIETSLSSGPQVISRRGKNTAVLISYDEYRKLTKKKTVKEVLMSTDISMLDLYRDRSIEGRATPIDYEDLTAHSYDNSYGSLSKRLKRKTQ